MISVPMGMFRMFASVMNTWIMFTVKDADVGFNFVICSLSTTWPKPTRLICVFGGGVPMMGIPATTRLTKVEPSALVWKPVASCVVVLTEIGRASCRERGWIWEGGG